MMVRHVATTLATLLVFGGSAWPRTPERTTPEEVRRVLSHTLRADELPFLKIPYKATPEIRRLAKLLTERANGDRQKLEELLFYFKERGFLDRYRLRGTKTAAEVLASGEGNCLSYANLFVAMARSVDLEAFYLDASEAQNELDHHHGLLLDYGHILVGVRIDGEIEKVDFDGETKNLRHFIVLSDLQAIADFYNNLGFEFSRPGGGQQRLSDTEVIQAFELATRIRPDFARAWNNLGVAWRQSGRIQDAAKAYRHAAAADPRMPAPHANLAQLLLSTGKPKEAVAEFRSAAELSPSNAYYRLFLGRALARAGRPKEALSELRQAARLDENLSQVPIEMAQILLEQDDLAEGGRILSSLLERFPNHPEGCRLLKAFSAHQADPPIENPAPTILPKDVCRGAPRL